MAVKTYEVLEDKKYTGKHRVYVAGQQFNESEVFGNIEVAIEKKIVKLVTGKTPAKKAGK